LAEATVVPLGDLSGLSDGQMRTCAAGPYELLVCRVKGALYALEDRCSHAETTLSDGLLTGYSVVCPRHGAAFDVRTGEHSGPPAWCGVPTFAVVEAAGTATVEVPAVRAPAVPPTDQPQMRFRTR